MYGTVKRLLEARWIVENGERPDRALDAERRRYYRLSDLGRRAVETEARRYEQLVKLARANRLF